MKTRFSFFSALLISVSLFVGCSHLEDKDSSAAAKCTIKNSKPENRAVVSPLNALQRLVSRLSCKELEALWTDRIFMQQIAKSPCASMPKGVDFVWDYNGNLTEPVFTLLLADNADFENKIEVPGGVNGVRVQNLIPGKKYFWTVNVKSDADADAYVCQSKISSFTLDDAWPRVLCIKGASNSRDLGGMTAMGGRKIPYGMLYRSSEIASGICPEKAACRKKQCCENCFPLDLGVRTEIDLRWANETNGQAASGFANANYVNLPAWLYNSMYTHAGMRNYAAIFRELAKSENYPINFHCIVGADRTGTLAFLLQAVLGCSEEEIRKDYIFSTFSSPRYFSAIDLLIEGMSIYKSGENDPLQYAAERYLLKSGVSPVEIRGFQEIVLGKDVQISPVLETYLQIAEIKARFTATDAVEFVENSPIDGMMMQCGKEYPFAMAAWVENPAKFIGGDNNGTFLFQFDNPGRDVRYGSFSGNGLTANAYRVLEPFSKIALLNSQDKTEWSVKELAETAFPIKGNAKHIMLLVPANIALPEGYVTKALEYQDPNLIVASSAKAAPVIDGILDDEMWTSQTPVQLVAIDGAPVKTGRVMAYMGTNPEHDVLYIAVKVEDETFVGSEKPRDGNCWDDDEIEIFISAVGDSTYYQFIWNRVGSFLDGKGQNANWTVEKYEAKTGECEGGWVLEAAMPLEQLNLPNAIEINICTTDVPKYYQRNLGATGGTYHSREAFKPILLK